MIRLTYLILLIASFSFTTFSQVKYTWSGGNGDWQTASNWSPNGVPGTIDTVVINGGTITSDQNVTVASIYLDNGTIIGAGNFIITDSLIINWGNLNGTGTTTIASGAVAKFTSSSNKNLSNTIVDGSLTVIGAGTVGIAPGRQLINNGTVDIQNNNSFGSPGCSIVNNGNFIRSVQTATVIVFGSFTNNGVIEILTGTLSFSSSLNNSLQGEIKGVGTLSPGNNFTNDGAVSPGTSPGVLRVSGNYPQSSDGVLNIEIGGYDLTNRDSLSVTQQAQLNGTLNIIFTNNFTPQIGDVFPFLSYQSRSGEFSEVNFPNNVIGYIDLTPKKCTVS